MVDVVGLADKKVVGKHYVGCSHTQVKMVWKIHPSKWSSSLAVKYGLDSVGLCTLGLECKRKQTGSCGVNMLHICNSLSFLRDYLRELLKVSSFLPASSDTLLGQVLALSAHVFIPLIHSLKTPESLIQSSYGHHRTPCLGQTRGLLMHHLVNPGCGEKSQQGSGAICFCVSSGRRKHMLQAALCKDRRCSLAGTACGFGDIRGALPRFLSLVEP